MWIAWQAEIGCRLINDCAVAIISSGSGDSVDVKLLNATLWFDIETNLVGGRKRNVNPSLLCYVQF